MDMEDVMEEETEGLGGCLLHHLCQSFVPEGRPIFIKVKFLLIEAELVMKMLVFLVNLALHHKVAIVTKVLTVEVIACLTVLCVVVIIELDELVKNCICIMILSLNFVLW